MLVEIISSNWSFGYNACIVGDLDGDGRPELLVGQTATDHCRGCAGMISLGRG